MQDAKKITNAVVQLLVELKIFIEGLSNEDYSKSSSALFSGSIGQHLRHSLDHIQILVTTILYSNDSKTVYYDRRIRGTDVENNTEVAKKSINDLINQIKKIRLKDLEQNIKVEHMIQGNGEVFIFDSNPLRELFFTTHHLIHHNAILSAILKEKGVQTKNNFGVAPSTVEFNIN